jgi:tRNA (cytidine/uridine-2'-O-)-methyltransferase
LDDIAVKRAGLDYWPHLKLHVHEDLDEIYTAFNPERIFLASTKVKTCYWDQRYRDGDVFVFGPESRGLPESLLQQYPLQGIRIPMSENIRSLNLANSVAVVMFEALRQMRWGK